MRQTLKISIAATLIALVSTLSLLAFTPKHSPADTKEGKRFATVYFTYNGGGITDPAHWSSVSSLSGTGTAQLSGISFDDGTYPLDHGKPNSTVLGIVNTNYTPGQTQFTVSGVTMYSKP